MKHGHVFLPVSNFVSLLQLFHISAWDSQEKVFVLPPFHFIRSIDISKVNHLNFDQIHRKTIRIYAIK